MVNEEIELSEEELKQLDQEKQMKRDIEYLMEDKVFQRVILNGYIVKTAIVIGSHFTGSDSEVKALSAVSHLQSFLTNNK